MHTFRPIAALTLLLVAGAARAGLGGTGADIATDAARLHAWPLAAQASARSQAGTSFTRHPIALPSGGTAVEFVDAAGAVFAVSWTAPILPDLSVLLGSYKTNLDAVQQARRTLRSPRMLQADNGDWVVVSTGHLRAFQGYSYLRSKMPAGFDLQQLLQ